MASQLRLVKQTSGRLAQKSSEVSRAADTVHQRVDRVHHAADATHAEIRSMGKATTQKKETAKKAFLIVGIGASAGGFEAFTELLEHLPADTGMAFVFVQHLDPTHESKLAPLLSHSTQMHVTEIRDRTRVAPNHIYIIPPNTALILSHGVLHLSPRRTGDMHLPIDRFFQSLAEDQGNLAVGVILSGNGHDGTVGLKQIKASGGITFSQELSSAKYPGMPESAEGSGCVDFILPPPGIARELERIAGHEALTRVKAPKSEPSLPGQESDLTKLFTLVRSATGVDFSCYKLTTLKRRIMRRMVLRKIEKLEDYLRYLQEHPAEIELLFQDILINVTGFFRDPAAFNVLKKKIFPRIVKNKDESSPIRIWVPGCATGEEVYSLAISLHEFLGKNQNNKAIQIFGTDISEAMVGRARAGMYPRGIESEVSSERLRRYFQKVDSGYQISKFIRDSCVFAKQNVAEDPPFSKLDLISCRNLLIYLGLSLQKKVLPTFHYSLRPGGFLMLGTSETIGTFSNLFTLVDKRNKIYTRNETYSRPEIDFMPATVTESSIPRGGGRCTKAGRGRPFRSAEEGRGDSARPVLPAGGDREPPDGCIALSRQDRPLSRAANGQRQPEPAQDGAGRVDGGPPHGHHAMRPDAFTGSQRSHPHQVQWPLSGRDSGGRALQEFAAGTFLPRIVSRRHRPGAGRGQGRQAEGKPAATAGGTRGRAAPPGIEPNQGIASNHHRGAGSHQ